jgi:hypothetical protein
MTNSQVTQIALLKEQMMINGKDHQEIKATLGKISNKLDKVIEGKAEKSDLATLDNRIWYLVVGFLMLLAGIIATWFKK